MKFTSKIIIEILSKTISFIFQIIVLIAGCIFVINAIVNGIGIDISKAAKDFVGNELWMAILGTVLIFVDIGCTISTFFCLINDYKEFFNRF